MKKYIITLGLLFVLSGGSLAGEIHQAVQSNDLAKVDALLGTHPELADDKDSDGLTPLHYLAMRITVVVSLDSNAKGTAGVVAPQDTRIQVAKLLVSKGADVNAVCKSGTTPLLLAVRGNNLDLVKLLIEKGAETDVVMPTGGDKSCTLLHFAAFHDNPEMVKLLIAHKAPLNAKTDSGFTPLHTAAYLNSISAAKVLLQAGADLNAKDGKGRTPLAVAVREKNGEMTDLLKQCGGQ